MDLVDDVDMASGGRVPLAGGKTPNPSDATTTQLLDILFDEGFDMEGILRLLRQSQVGNQGDLPSGYQSTWRKAEGGRVPLFWGGTAGKKLWQEFIEKQFLKASNDIRQGKGLFKGLTQEQWIKQHDNLTKKLKEWEMGGKKSLPKDMKEYFGMNEIQLANAFKKAEAGSKELDILQKFVPEGKPHATGGRVSLSAGGLAGMLGE